MSRVLHRNRARMPRQETREASRFGELAVALAELGREFYKRGWAVGTSGNFSAVVRWQPLRLAVTPTGLDKGALSPNHILEIDDAARVIRGVSRPSTEALMHLAVVRLCGAGAVLHTHSLWGTILSDSCADAGALTLEGYEMLKGLEGVTTHLHLEWLPIVENSQDIAALAQGVEEVFRHHPRAHGFLIRRHGLYSWGRNLAEAKRHVEILEFLMEVAGRTRGLRMETAALGR